MVVSSGTYVSPQHVTWEHEARDFLVNLIASRCTPCQSVMLPTLRQRRRVQESYVKADSCQTSGNQIVSIRQVVNQRVMRSGSQLSWPCEHWRSPFKCRSRYQESWTWRASCQRSAGQSSRHVRRVPPRTLERAGRALQLRRLSGSHSPTLRNLPRRG
jgi:hypothetical protein